MKHFLDKNRDDYNECEQTKIQLFRLSLLSENIKFLYLLVFLLEKGGLFNRWLY